MEPSQAGSDTGLHRAFGKVQDHCDLPIGVAPVVGELDRHTFVGRDAQQRLFDLLGLGERHEGRIDIGLRCLRFEPDALLPPLACVVRPDNVDSTAMGLGEQQRAELAAGRVEAGRLPPQPEEDVLGDVLGKGAIAEQSPGQARNRRAVASEHFGEGRFVALPDGGHQRLIGSRGQEINLHTVTLRHETSGGWRFWQCGPLAIATDLPAGPHDPRRRWPRNESDMPVCRTWTDGSTYAVTR